jgi:hypothetical protein
MIGPYTRALAFVTACFLAGRRANLLLAIGLDDMDLAVVAQQRPIDEVVEPGFR